MQAFVNACRGAPSFAQLTAILPQIVGNQVLHALFLNTLSRLEYVGVRKMLKVRRSDCLDLDGLQHILEEAVHAVRLKKFAHSLHSAPVDTYAAECTLDGEAAERYFQKLDAACANQLSTNTNSSREQGLASTPVEEIAYLLTSTAIEVRAQCLYPAYQASLRKGGSKISVASILNDEEHHLEQMAAKLPALLPDWRARLTIVLQAEESAFAQLIDAWTQSVAKRLQAQ